MYLSLVLGLLPLAPAQTPAFVVETKPARRVTCVLEEELHFGDGYQLNELLLVAAAAPELPHHQQKVRTRILAPREGVPGQEAEPPFRPFVVTQFRPATKQTTYPVRVQYEATLLERRLVPRAAGRPAPPVPPLAGQARESYLAATEWYDYGSSEFRQWLDRTKLRREDRESPLAFAQRAFLALAAQFTYKSATPGRPASQVIALPEADCDTLAFVYIATLRANGVPARLLLGRSAKETLAAREGRLPGHATVEFFADGVGWVICDPAGGVSRRQKNPLQAFGVSTGTFLVLQVEPDIKVPRLNKSDPVHVARTLTSPYRSWRGKGTSESKMVPVSWTVTAGPP